MLTKRLNKSFSKQQQIFVWSFSKNFVESNKNISNVSLGWNFFLLTWLKKNFFFSYFAFFAEEKISEVSNQFDFLERQDFANSLHTLLCEQIKLLKSWQKIHSIFPSIPNNCAFYIINWKLLMMFIFNLKWNCKRQCILLLTISLSTPFHSSDLKNFCF
jgi:hypothetical protein